MRTLVSDQDQAILLVVAVLMLFASFTALAMLVGG